MNSVQVLLKVICPWPELVYGDTAAFGALISSARSVSIAMTTSAVPVQVVRSTEAFPTTRAAGMRAAIRQCMPFGVFSNR